MPLCIHPFHSYFLGVFCISAFMLGTGNVSVRQKEAPALKELYNEEVDLQ